MPSDRPKVRDLGVYAEVAPSETPASELAGRKGVIISGGPSSVYDPGSPRSIPRCFRLGHPGAWDLLRPAADGALCWAARPEGRARRIWIRAARNSPVAGDTDTLLHGIDGPPASLDEPSRPGGDAARGIRRAGEHRDLPDRGDRRAGSGNLYAVQFHPEVAHTPCGRTILSNFLFDICGCERDWDPAGQIRSVEDQIRTIAGDRNIFFFVSGGVDSTVAYTLCLHALGPERVHGTYVDTGLMREGETEFVRENFAKRWAPAPSPWRMRARSFWTRSRA